MLDLSMIHNPYDFSNPVSDEELFTGREKELEEIKYYMEHAKKAPRPINIALLGPRASGKTSLLNICELEAKRRNLCTIRINLDESHAKNVPVFFYTIFNSILTEVCELGGYNGKNGKTYETYIDLISTYEIPPDKICCPFIFPLTYIKAKSKNNLDTIDFDDNMYQEDLKSLSSEIKCPIILLFDECNVLSKSRIILEKLRNIFMSTPGYMLIFTGTPDLFPVMDEVFSPIIRQFKKIKVDNFTSKDETKECIEKPLKKIKIDPESIFDYRYLDGIHELSGGHPYIIQLICHKLFQEVETRRANKMKLDQRIIDDITKERKTTQDINYSQTFNKIENLIPKEPDLNHNTKNIQKLTTKDITLEGEIEANFIFNKDNFELLGKKFVNLLKTVKKSEIIYFLILDDVANIEMKLPSRPMYYYDPFSCYNYEFNREKFLKLKDKIDLKRWTNIYTHFEEGPREKESYYTLGDKINLDTKFEKLLSKQDLELIKTKMNNEGKILESDLIKILWKYKDIDTSYISSDKLIAREITAENLPKEEANSQLVLVGEYLLDNKHHSTHFDDIINSLAEYKITCTQKNYWGISYDNEEFEKYLKSSYGCTDEEIKLLKTNLKKYPFDNRRELEILQYIRELVFLYGCNVKVKVEPFRQIWMRTGEQKILNSVALKKEYLNFNYYDIKNSLDLSDEDQNDIL